MDVQMPVESVPGWGVAFASAWLPCCSAQKLPPQILRERALAPAEGVEPLPQRPATCCARRGGAAVREDAVSAVFRMQFYIPGSGGVCNS